MSEKVRKQKNARYLLAGTGLTLVILCMYTLQLSVPVISDETTTMANAAWLTNRDWSLMIASLGGYYYRYIQAIMTVPFFAFLKDPAMIYRLSMILQAIIQTTIVPVVYIICRRHLQMKSAGASVLLGMAVCLVPSMALYTLYYRGDYLLGVLPWYVLLTFLETIKAAEENRKWSQCINTILGVLFCGVAYMAHTRGIVLIIALVIIAAGSRFLLRKRSLCWPVLIAATCIVFFFDSKLAGSLKNALYAIGGSNVNTFESTDIGGLFNIFSYSAIKDLVMLCASWTATLIFSTQGLVLIGLIVSFLIIWKIMIRRRSNISDVEAVVVMFSFLVFAGYYAMGALFFRGTYLALATKTLERRVDRLLYDRYAICGAGMLVFVALYTLCFKTDWLKRKGKAATFATALAVTVFCGWKILPIALRYTGYLYNTITLNTFQTISSPGKILTGEYYGKQALILAALLGLGLMAMILLVSVVKKKWMPYVVLSVVLLSDLFLIHVNFIKIRKSSNDYVVEATADVTAFMQEFEDEVTAEYPYVLKGGLSGTKIQFYQSQLMDYKMFGKNQAEQLGADNYFIISKQGDIDLTWYEDDYYLFDDYDYENAAYDIVYVKGEALMQKMEDLGYAMTKYVPSEQSENAGEYSIDEQ